MAPHGHHRPERSWHGREANRPRVGHTQSPGPVAGNLGGGSVHVHDSTSCNAAVLAHVHTRSGPGAEEAGPKGNAGSPGVLCGRPSSLTRAADRAPAAWKHRPPPKVGLGRGWPHRAPTGTRTILGHTCRASLVLRHGPGQRGDRLSSHPHRPGSPTRMGLVLGTPAAATNTARAGPWDTTPIPRWTASYHMGRYPRYRVPSVRPVGLSQPAPHGIKNLEAKTPPATGKIHLQVTV